MGESREVSILDVTIRDGSYTINYQYTPDQVGRISAALGAAGIDFIEVSHGCGLGASENLGLPAAASDLDYVKAAKAALGAPKVGVIGGGPPVTLEKDIDTIIEHVDFIRFAANCDNPKNVEKNIRYAKKLRPNLTIFMQMMRSSRRPQSTIMDSARQAADMGVETLYLVDTAGHFLPEEVEEIVGGLVGSSNMRIGFHGHNNLGLANANTLAAIRAGAQSVDASLRGMGRAGGNAQLESLVSLMKRMGLARSVDLDALITAGEEILEPIMAPSKGTSAIDVITADANIDLYPIGVYMRIAEAAGVEFTDFVRALGSDELMVEAGLDEMRRALKKLGANPEKAFEAVGLKQG